MEVKTTATAKLPLTSGKDATLTLEDGVVSIVTPVSLKTPAATLEDLQVAVIELASVHESTDGLRVEPSS